MAGGQAIASGLDTHTHTPSRAEQVNPNKVARFGVNKKVSGSQTHARHQVGQDGTTRHPNPSKNKIHSLRGAALQARRCKHMRVTLASKPMAQTSTFAQYGVLSNMSGAMNGGVP